jgi:hypothetical protein
VATPARPFVVLPPPDAVESAALHTASTYLTRAGTQLASRLLGCPHLTDEIDLVADLSNLLPPQRCLVPERA